MHGLQGSLTLSPELFPYSLDPRSDLLTFIHLSAGDYQSASFLDARILTPHMRTRPLPFSQVTAALEASPLEERCSFIFHIGHVGSTLLSRLLGAHRSVFALREPLLLRTFAQVHGEPKSAPSWREGDFEARLTGALRLLSRTFDRSQLPLIKATSFVSELSTSLMARAAAPRAVLTFVRPEVYLATILGGPNSRAETKTLGPPRLRRLQRRLGTEEFHIESLSEGESFAMSWACEMSALAQAASVAGERAYWLDFDRFLANPAGLFSVFQHLRIDTAQSEVDTILGGPEMRRYSKAPEYAYDAALRQDVLNEARALHGAEIRRGLNWLDQAAARFELVRQALAVVASN
jgi:hypothetical protein